MLIENNHNRNPFLALCDNASQNDWCWNINCTTCGHGAFRVSFNKLMTRDEHPDDASFWPFGKGNSEPLQEFKKHPEYRDYYYTYDNQQKLVEIVVGAKIADINTLCRFPDWLGYIGLVMAHCPSRRAQMTLSSHFIPQFLTFFEKDNEIKGYLENKQLNNEPLTIADLNKIEKHWPFLG
jgi:hypothetical protein